MIDENKGISVGNGIWEDAGSQRLGNGEFRLKGWLRYTGSNTLSISIIVGGSNDQNNTFLSGQNKLVTIACSCKLNTQARGALRVGCTASGNGSTRSTYLSEQKVLTSEYQEVVYIFSNSGDTHSNPNFRIYPDKGIWSKVEPIYIDVTFKDLRCFEGAFVNPPVGHSLDTSVSPLFINHSMGDEVTLDMRAGFPVQRIREITTPYTTTGLSKIQVRLSGKTIASDGYEHIFVAYLYEVLGDKNLSTVFKRHLIKYLARNYNGTAAIRHKSITLQDDYTMRFPTNSQGAAYDTTLITWNLDGSSINSQKTSTCLLTGVATQLPPNTKLYIQPLVIEDSGNYQSVYPWYKVAGWTEVFS